MSKFIYIIDHQEQRYLDLYKQYVDFTDYSFVRFVQTLPPLATICADAVCVCVHDSFPDSNTAYQLDILYNQLSDAGILTVQFSNTGNRATSLENDGFPLRMQSHAFYQNIRLLLEDYKNTNNVNIKVLAYGLQWKKQLAIDTNKQIQTLLLGRNDDDIIDLSNGSRVSLIKYIKYFGELSNNDINDMKNRLLNEELKVNELKYWLNTEIQFIS
jgi:hypothetical protein